MQPFKVAKNDNQIIISENNKQIMLHSSLSKNDTITLLRQYIKQCNVQGTEDLNVRSIDTNEDWSCLYFKNTDNDIVLTIDFRNSIILNSNGIESTKSYISKVTLNIHDIKMEEQWINNFMGLLQSSFIYKSERDIVLNTYFRNGCNDLNKLKTIEIFAKQGYQNITYQTEEYFKKVYDLINENKKFKFYSIFGITLSQYKLCCKKNLINQPDFHHVFIEIFKNKNQAPYIEYLVDKYNTTYAYNVTKFVDAVLNNEFIMKNYDIYKVVDYVFVDCNHQGIDSFTEASKLLSDYINMNVDMRIVDFVRYPKYLKTYHDIILKNYKVKLNDIKNNKYMELKETKRYLEFNKDEFNIIVPNTLQDIVVEGSTLNHCVASYIDKVLDQKSFICFMRKTEELDKPLITLEIVDDYILHCKGQSNRNPNEEESKFLSNYQVFLNKKF